MKKHMVSQEKIEAYADAILKASGSALRHYSMHKTREDIFAAVRAAIEAEVATIIEREKKHA